MSDIKKFGLTGIGANVELGKGGPRIVVNGAAIEAKNAANNALAIMRGADPQGDTDFVTKKYLETQAQVTVVGEIYDVTGTVTVYPALPTATNIYMCTETSGSFTARRLYRFVSGGPTLIASWTEYTPFAGMRIATTIDLNRGTDVYTSDHIYLWDAEGAEWVDIGPSSESHSVKTVRGTLAWDAAGGAFNIGLPVPAGARAVRAIVSVTTLFDGTAPATLTLGSGGGAAEIAAAAEINLAQTGIYIMDCYVKYAAQTQLTRTFTAAVGGTPSTGAADIEIEYSIA